VAIWVRLLAVRLIERLEAAWGEGRPCPRRNVVTLRRMRVGDGDGEEAKWDKEGRVLRVVCVALQLQPVGG